MKAARTRLPCWRAAGVLVLAASLTSCGLLPAGKAQAARTLTLPAARSSELIVITDQETPTAMKTVGALLVDSARVGEHVVITGISAATALSAPSVPATLQGSTVVVDDFPGTDDEEAAWQAALDQSGARRTVVLTPATSSQLAATVQQGLDGAVADTLTSVLFGLGSSTLGPAALPQLRRLLHLLTVTYPDATATIDGYTDNLPAPGGNLQLSLRRAREVLTWLVANKVPASHLQAVGCGDANPVAPNKPDGQPLNRRVVVIIDPVTGGLSALATMPVGPITDNLCCTVQVMRCPMNLVTENRGNTMLGGASMDYGIVLPNGWVSPGVNAAKSHQACARRRLTIA